MESPKASAAVPSTIALAAVFIVFLSALAGALLPLYFLTKAASDTTFIRLGNSFAAGILSAAGFVHLLPGGDRAFHKLFPHVHYPYAGLLALVGAVVVFLVDHVIRHGLCHKRRDQQPLLGHVDTGAASTTVTYILAAALSVHSLIEGLTLGASVIYSSQFVAMLTAIVAHKAFAAVSLGTSLAGLVLKDRSRSTRTGAVIAAVTFALLTPIGAGTGVGMVHAMDEWEARVLSAGLNCVSAGIFVYVALVELLAEEMRLEEKRGMGGRAVVFAVAAALMSALAVWT